MEESNSSLDFSELLKMVQRLMEQQKIREPNRISELDKIVSDQPLRVMKAALPYFDADTQVRLASFLKLTELKKAMHLINDEDPTGGTKLPRKEFNRIQLLSDIRDSCDERDQKKLNSMLMLYHLRETMNETKKNPPKAVDEKPAEDPYNQFKNMMNKIIREKE